MSSQRRAECRQIQKKNQRAVTASSRGGQHKQRPSGPSSLIRRCFDVLKTGAGCTELWDDDEVDRRSTLIRRGRTVLCQQQNKSSLIKRASIAERENQAWTLWTRSRGPRTLSSARSESSERRRWWWGGGGVQRSRLSREPQQ